MVEMATKKGSRTQSSPSRHRGLGFLFWVCLAAIAVAVGIAAREPLKAAFTQLSRGPAAAPAPAREPPKVTVAPLAEADQRPKGRPAVPAPQTERPAEINSAEKGVTSPPERPAIRKARLYFASVDQSGKIQLKSVIRPIPASD